MAVPKMWRRVISADKARPTLSGSAEVLRGAPQSILMPGQGYMQFGMNPELVAEVRRAASAQGERVPSQYAELDPQRAKSFADEFGLMESEGKSKEAQQAYAALAREISSQYENLLRAGYTHDYYPRNASGELIDPYENPRWAVDDINQNRRLMTFPTYSGYGSGEQELWTPLLEPSAFKTASGQPMTVNDEFRFAHDLLGHTAPGVGFRAAGEENAFLWHAPTLSPQARRAVTAELRGQNSYLNFGPYGEHNRTANAIPYDEATNPQGTRYADQKYGVMPRWASEVGRESERASRFERMLAEGKTGLEGAVDPATGEVTLQHWANQTIDRTDPTRMLTGLDARNKEIRNRLSDPAAVQRTYFGIPSTEAPYRREPGLGDVRHIARLHGSQLYPIDMDPEGFAPLAKGYSPQERVTNMERLIAEQNYSGYYRRHPQLGTVASVFDPLKVQRGAASTEALGATAALGLGAAAVEGANGQIGESLKKTGADIGYLGDAIGKLVSNPETYSAAARWAGKKASDLWTGNADIPTAGELGRGALLGLADTGNMFANMGAMMQPARIQHLLETGQSLNPWGDPNLDYAPQTVRDADYRMKRREDAMRWLENQGYSDVSRLATGFLSPI